jgi:Spy/CpxP family protein refolding chaperone
MKKISVFILACIALTLVIGLAIHRSSRAQGGFLSAEEMLMQVLPLERSWSYVSFELDVTDKQLPDVRKVYQKSWKERKKLAVKAAAAVGDPEAMAKVKDEAQEMKNQLDENLKTVLTPKQLEKLAEHEEEIQAQIEKAIERAREAGEKIRERRGRP